MIAPSRKIHPEMRSLSHILFLPALAICCAVMAAHGPAHAQSSGFAVVKHKPAPFVEIRPGVARPPAAKSARPSTGAVYYGPAIFGEQDASAAGAGPANAGPANGGPDNPQQQAAVHGTPRGMNPNLPGGLNQLPPGVRAPPVDPVARDPDDANGDH